MKGRSFVGGLMLGAGAWLFLQGAALGAPPTNPDAMKKIVERGKYLVNIGGCNDCHSPKKFGPNGPEPDPERLLSGHPSGNTVPAMPDGVLGMNKWGGATTPDMTAWIGPWGVSFTANLTPDKATGLGSWTEAMFIKALRTGKHMGEGRPILPPMPWPGVGGLTDADLKAVFTYLRSLKPIANAVPDPLPPPGAPAGTK